MAKIKVATVSGYEIFCLQLVQRCVCVCNNPSIRRESKARACVFWITDQGWSKRPITSWRWSSFDYNTNDNMSWLDLKIVRIGVTSWRSYKIYSSKTLEECNIAQSWFCLINDGVVLEMQFAPNPSFAVTWPHMEKCDGFKLIDHRGDISLRNCTNPVVQIGILCQTVSSFNSRPLRAKL